MRDLVLVFPDGLPSETAASAVSATALTRLRFGAARSVAGGWRAMLARGFGRGELAWLSPAALLEAAQSLEPSELAPWLATPLHWQAGLTTVHVPEGGVLHLPEEEAEAWARAFAQVFSERGLQLVPVGSTGFLLRGLGDRHDTSGGVQTVEPAALLDTPLADAQPTGPGSRSLRALMAEIELWLHDAPLNAARRARGVPVISSLWLWGGGAPARDLPTRRAGACRWARVLGDETFVRALGVLAEIEIEALPESIERLLDRREALDESICAVLGAGALGTPHRLDAESIDRRALAPAARALADGRLARLTLVAPDRAVTVRATDRFRLWQPRRSWLTALGENGA